MTHSDDRDNPLAIAKGDSPENRKPTLDEWRGIIPNLRKIGQEHKGSCPSCGAGDDRFWIKDDGTFGCRHGCSFEEVMRAAGRWNDAPTGGVVTLTDAWKYQNTKGESVTVTRQRGKGTPCRRHPKGIKGPYLPLDLDKLDKGKPIVICEGERCRDAIRDNTTHQATCWIGGAQNWAQTDWETLAGCKCVLWPDNDQIGKTEMRKLMGHLDKVGCSISVVTPPKDRPDGWDAADCDPEEIQGMLDGRANLSKAQVERMTGDGKGKHGVPILVQGKRYEKKKVDWIIPGWLATGGLTLLAGPGGMGKTTIAMGLAAAVSRGGKWGGDGLPVVQGGVLIWSGEDDIQQILLPNLDAAKADLEHTYFTAEVPTESGPREFEPANDMAGLATAIQKVGNLKLLIIDPIIAVAENTKDSYSAKEIRKALRPVEKLAKTAGVAVLGITHLVKAGAAKGYTAQDQVIGSSAWVHVARMAWQANNTDAGKALFRVKSNYSNLDGGFQYRIDVDDQGDGIQGRVVSFGESIEGKADDNFAQQPKQKAAPAKNTAAAWLKAYFADNPEGDTWERIVEAAAASEEHIASETLKRARGDLKKQGVIGFDLVGFGEGRKTVWKAVESSDA